MKSKFVNQLAPCAAALMAVCGVSHAEAPSYAVYRVHPELGKAAPATLNQRVAVVNVFHANARVCAVKACIEVPPLAGANPNWGTTLNAINKNGYAAGSSPTDQLTMHAMYFNGMTTHKIGAIDDDGCGGCTHPSVANDINNRGQIVGVSETAFGHQGFLWDGVLTPLPTLGGNGSAAYAINDNSVIVGYSWVAPDTPHAVLYRNGQIQDLGVLGTDTTSAAYDINSRNVAVGYSGALPFIYKQGAMSALPLPAAGSGKAWRINDAGWVVGTYRPTGAFQEAGWVYDGHDSYDLNALIPAAAQAEWHIESAADINATGHILVKAVRWTDPFAYETLLLKPQVR